VALSPGEGATAATLSGTPEPTSGEITAGTPAEAFEKLFGEGVRAQGDGEGALLGEIDRMEGRLEATGTEQFALREALRREKERSEELRAEPEAERPASAGSGGDSAVDCSEGDADGSQVGLPHYRPR
jgi:hypothetical protein